MTYQSMKNRTCPIRKVVSREDRTHTYKGACSMDWRHELLECGHEYMTHTVDKTPIKRRCLECSKKLNWCVCYLNFDRDGKVLCITRKEDPYQVGLVGGKVDPEDGDLVLDLMGTLKRAIVREASEECGHVLSANALYEVYRGLDYGPMGAPKSKTPTICAVFSPVRVDGYVERRSGEGELVRLLPREILQRSRFLDYDTKLFKALRNRVGGL